MTNMVSQIEVAIISTLKSAPGLSYLKTVDSYGGQFDDDIGEVIRAYPAVWVVFGGSGTPKPYGTEKWKVPATFVTIVAARNVRDEESSRRGSSGEPGTYQMLDDVRAMLIREDFGLAIERLQPGPVKTLYNTRLRGQALSVFSQEWSTAYIATMPSVQQVDWLKLGIDYKLKPGDDIADASDLITLT
jgi:phage gp37-like protein